MNVDNRKIYLLGMTLNELNVVAAGMGLPSYAASQLADWLYKKKVTSVSEMTNIAKAKRILLEASYEVGAKPPVGEMKSTDGTVKYLFHISSDHAVETVYIPDNDRSTLCVSSQVGCRMNCHFCMTGKQGFAANLTANEIINQIRSVPESEQLTNIVFMGMGEPFDNTDELFKVLEIMTSDYGYGWSPKRITVSTVGVMKGLHRFLEESTCHLAVSLHSPYSDERQSLMPIEKIHPVAEIIRLVKQYDFSHQRRVSFEYILFENMNDSPEHAEALVRLLKGLTCRVNLIRFHAIPEAPFKSSSLKKMEYFRDMLNLRGIMCTIRTSRGEDILAACGMLSTIEKNTRTK
jgi:23S rRNA (adenine2503-C2)-methyltransferase